MGLLRQADGSPISTLDVDAIAMSGFKYDDTERVVGCWTNGKPIYRRFIQTTAPSTTDGTNASKTVDLGVRIERCVNLYSYVYILDDQCVPLPYTANSVSSNTLRTICAFVDCDSITEGDGNIKNTLRMISSIASANGKIVEAIIEYTKTTDPENSFDIEMLYDDYQASVIKSASKQKYSTDEIVIGEWIDGRPLYRKCYEGININYQTTNAWLSLGIQLPNANLIKADIKRNDNNKTGVVNFTYTSLIDDYIKVFNYNVINIQNTTVILEYTKTTDPVNSFSVDFLPTTKLEEEATDEDLAEVWS